MMWQAVHEHTAAAAAAAVSWVAGGAVMFAQVVGAQVNDGVIVGVALFIAGTLTTFLGWLAVVVVRATQVLARLETTAEDHERRLTSGGI
jgi:hypothetical protein